MVNSASFMSSIFEALAKISDAYDLNCPDSVVQDNLRIAASHLLATLDYFKTHVRSSFNLD